ncbi:MAG: pyruvate synthase subunit PorB [Halobacteriota archaeon]|nr:pyruvate synthase subunit PorB [Halobacteriota archaeon]
MIGAEEMTERLLTKEEYFSPGHRACIGCGEALAMRLIAKALGENVIIVNATGCSEIIASALPTTSWKVPWIHTLFENASSVASGIESGIKALERKGKRKKAKVVAFGGDGATSDIGLQSLSGALERGHDLLYVCFDNEAYMNTGIQRSSSTPYGAWTTTAPSGKASIGQKTWKKNMPEIIAAHHIPYVATASPSYPYDLIDKAQKALAIDGPAYLHVYAACPTGWRCKTDITIRLGRLAVETGIFPLYEVEDGKYKMTIDPDELKPVKEYLKLQRRFAHLTDELIDEIQEKVTMDYQSLKEKVEGE